MRKTTASKIMKPQLQLLLLGGSEQDFTNLRELLMVGSYRHLRFEHASSTDDVIQQKRKRRDDLVLCGDQSTDNVALQLLRQVRQDDSRVPVMFLSDPANEAARKQSDPEETLRKLWRSVEQSADTVIIMDRSGAMEYVNPAFETLTGYSRQEAVGQTLAMLESEQQASNVYEEVWKTVLSGDVFRGIVMDRKKNGETLIIENTVTPLRDGSGQITHFISTGRDITGWRKLESDLQQAQKMDSIGRLAGGVAHDFNNLLLIISAYAELALDSVAEEHPLRRNLNEIINASRRAADLTRELLGSVG